MMQTIGDLFLRMTGHPNVPLTAHLPAAVGSSISATGGVFGVAPTAVALPHVWRYI
jgi:hypothetical protein